MNSKEAFVSRGTGTYLVWAVTSPAQGGGHQSTWDV